MQCNDPMQPCGYGTTFESFKDKDKDKDKLSKRPNKCFKKDIKYDNWDLDMGARVIVVALVALMALLAPVAPVALVAPVSPIALVTLVSLWPIRP